MAGKEVVDIAEYKSRANAANFIEILEKCSNATAPQGTCVTPYRNMIAIGREGEHFCWFHYRAGRNNVDCIIEPAIAGPHFREVKELLSQARIKWKNLHRARSTSRTIDIHVSADQVKQKDKWSCIERVLKFSATG